MCSTQKSEKLQHFSPFSSFRQKHLRRPHSIESLCPHCGGKRRSQDVGWRKDYPVRFPPACSLWIRHSPDEGGPLAGSLFLVLQSLEAQVQCVWTKLHVLFQINMIIVLRNSWLIFDTNLSHKILFTSISPGHRKKRNQTK